MRLLTTDLENTVYDRGAYFANSFTAMLFFDAQPDYTIEFAQNF
jgi:hypothetical protein